MTSTTRCGARSCEIGEARRSGRLAIGVIVVDVIALSRAALVVALPQLTRATPEALARPRLDGAMSVARLERARLWARLCDASSAHLSLAAVAVQSLMRRLRKQSTLILLGMFVRVVVLGVRVAFRLRGGGLTSVATHAVGLGGLHSLRPGARRGAARRRRAPRARSTPAERELPLRPSRAIPPLKERRAPLLLCAPLTQPLAR